MKTENNDLGTSIRELKRQHDLEAIKAAIIIAGVVLGVIAVLSATTWLVSATP